MLKSQSSLANLLFEFTTEHGFQNLCLQLLVGELFLARALQKLEPGVLELGPLLLLMRLFVVHVLKGQCSSAFTLVMHSIYALFRICACSWSMSSKVSALVHLLY